MTTEQEIALADRWCLAGYVGDHPAGDEHQADDELPVLAFFNTEAEAKAAVEGAAACRGWFWDECFAFVAVAPGDEIPTFRSRVEAWGADYWNDAGVTS